MTRTTTFAITLFVLLLAVPQGTALHCNGDIVTIGTGPVILYIDDRSSDTGQINHWFYLESNGVEGLQSGDDDVICKDCSPVPFTFTDPCQHLDPDELIL